MKKKDESKNSVLVVSKNHAKRLVEGLKRGEKTVSEQESKEDGPKGFKGTNSHKLTQEDRMKGGKVKSERKTKANRSKARIWCSAKCPSYPCIYLGEGKKKGRQKCVRPEGLPKDAKVANILSGSEAGFKKALQTLSAESSMDRILSPGEKAGRIRALNDVYKTLWGSKLKVEGNISTEPNAENFAKVFDEYLAERKKRRKENVEGENTESKD